MNYFNPYYVTRFENSVDPYKLASEKLADQDPHCFQHCIYYIEPVHEISNNVVCTTSKASDQPVHTRSLIRAFTSCLSIL